MSDHQERLAGIRRDAENGRCSAAQVLWLLDLINDGAQPLRDTLAKIKARSPYGEWCRDPNLCLGKGYCPRDPTCGD